MPVEAHGKCYMQQQIIQCSVLQSYISTADHGNHCALHSKSMKFGLYIL